jgi:hypothetical protein
VIVFDDGTSSKMQLIVSPITLVMGNYPSDTRQSSDPSKYVMYLGVVRTTMDMKPQIFNLERLSTTYILLVVILLASVVVTALCIFHTSHSVIRPLRQLNAKMRETLESKA